MGVVATQPKVKGGVLFVTSADKAARFLGLCDAFGLPLLFVYLFTVWMLLIVLAAFALGAAGPGDPDCHGTEPGPAD